LNHIRKSKEGDDPLEVKTELQKQVAKHCCGITFESQSEYLEHIEENHIACGCG